MMKNPNPVYNWTVGDTAFYHDVPANDIRAGIVGNVIGHTATIAPCPTIEEWEQGMRRLKDMNLSIDCLFESPESAYAEIAR